MDCSPPGSSVHGILQTRTLEWVAMPSPRGSSQPRDWSRVSHISDRFFTIWATREADGHSQINELLSPLVLWLINKEMLKLMGQKHMDSPWLETVSYNLKVLWTKEVSSRCWLEYSEGVSFQSSPLSFYMYGVAGQLPSLSPTEQQASEGGNWSVPAPHPNLHA